MLVAFAVVVFTSPMQIPVALFKIAFFLAQRLDPIFLLNKEQFNKSGVSSASTAVAVVLNLSAVVKFTVAVCVSIVGIELDMFIEVDKVIFMPPATLSNAVVLHLQISYFLVTLVAMEPLLRFVESKVLWDAFRKVKFVLVNPDVPFNQVTLTSKICDEFEAFALNVQLSCVVLKADVGVMFA
mgnify:CR=1 FL=1